MSGNRFSSKNLYYNIETFINEFITSEFPLKSNIAEIVFDYAGYEKILSISITDV